MKGLEPSTFCMASRRSSQLSYIRARGEYSPAARRSGHCTGGPIRGRRPASERIRNAAAALAGPTTHAPEKEYRFAMAVALQRLRKAEYQWADMSADELVAEHQALLHRLEACSAVASLSREAAEIAEESHRPLPAEYRGTWRWIGVSAMASAMRRARRSFYAVDAARAHLERHEQRLALATFNALVRKGTLGPEHEYAEWRRDNGPRIGSARLDWQALADEAPVG